MKKKQKELSRKHSGGSTDQAAEQIKDDTEEEEEDEEDSDLASIGKNHALKNQIFLQLCNFTKFLLQKCNE